MMIKSASFLVVCGSLVGGIAFADSHLTHERAGHEAHEQTTPKGGMHQRHHGAGKSDRTAMLLGMMDDNKDGMLSRDEVQKHVDRMFVEADSNKDGAISKAELDAHHKQMHDRMHAKMQERWKAADKDGDGALTRAEVDAADLRMLSRNFERIDRNKDGRLTSDELRRGMMPHRRPAPPPAK